MLSDHRAVDHVNPVNPRRSTWAICAESLSQVIGRRIWPPHIGIVGEATKPLAEFAEWLMRKKGLANAHPQGTVCAARNPVEK